MASLFAATITYAPASTAAISSARIVGVWVRLFIAESPRFYRSESNAGLPFWDHPHRRPGLEGPAPRRFGQWAGRPIVRGNVSDIHGGILPALERLHDHVEIVVGVGHHVRGESSAGILFLKSLLESNIPKIAVGVPRAFEQLRPLSDRWGHDRSNVADVRLEQLLAEQFELRAQRFNKVHVGVRGPGLRDHRSEVGDRIREFLGVGDREADACHFGLDRLDVTMDARIVLREERNRANVGRATFYAHFADK